MGGGAGGGGLNHQILLPSAVHLEERLTVSQAVPEPGQQSVGQKHTVWVFCQWQTRAQAVGTPIFKYGSIGRMVMQLAADFWSAVRTPVRRIRRWRRRRRRECAEPPTVVAVVCCVTIRPAVVHQRYASPLPGAFSAKTFDPPTPPPPPKKVISSFRG